MKYDLIEVGMKVAVRTGGATADDIKTGRKAVRGVVVAKGKYRMAKQGACQDYVPVPAGDIPGVDNVVVVEVPKVHWRYRGPQPRPDVVDGMPAPTEQVIFASGQLYPWGIFEAGQRELKLVMDEMQAYQERKNALLELFKERLRANWRELIENGTLRLRSVDIQFTTRRGNPDEEIKPHINFDVEHGATWGSRGESGLWAWLKVVMPAETAEYLDVEKRLKCEI